MKPKLILHQPIARYGYFDKIQFWVIDPLDQHALDLLKAECGRGGLFVINKHARFDHRFRQRVQLRQPTENALRLLEQRNDVLINGAEIALDLIFKYQADAEEAWDFFHQHWVRRWHRKGQEIRIRFGQTRYDARRSAPNLLVLYPDDHTRVTGELNCLHIEWRAKGVRATRAAGINTPEDLLVFNHRAFWQKRLVFYSVNRRQLGRLIRNRATGRRRRTPEIICETPATIQKGKFQYRIDIEARTGEVFARSYDTVQQLIDALKRLCRIHRALIPISNEMLLPPKHTYLLYTQTTCQLDPVLASKSDPGYRSKGYLLPKWGTNLLLDLAKLTNATGIPLLANVLSVASYFP